MSTTALIELLTAAIAAYSQIVADLHKGAITPAEAEAKIAAHHALLASARAAEDAQIADAQIAAKP